MRARYEVVRGTPVLLVIRDVGHETGCSVTNDAEAVVADLHARGMLPMTRELLYYDSEGRLDSLTHDGYGRFLGFGPVPVGACPSCGGDPADCSLDGFCKEAGIGKL